jgi:hypothetical protein
MKLSPPCLAEPCQAYQFGMVAYAVNPATACSMTALCVLLQHDSLVHVHRCRLT